MSIDYAKEAQFYKDILYNDILPFWEKHAPDTEHGGFFTCFSNDGAKMLSTDKYIWSQGRMLWCLSRILKRDDLSGERRERLMHYAHEAADFLTRHARLEDGSCTFLTDREGNKKLSGEVYDSSIYVDCFVIIGLSEYASLTGLSAPLSLALEIYRHARARFEGGRYRTEPYPVPTGYRVHGLPMIFTNTARTLADAMRSQGHPDTQRISENATAFARDVIDSFVDGDGVLHEMIRTEGEPFDTDTLLGRYINPGHTVEDCWFMATEWELSRDGERMEKTHRVFENALARGWDSEHGGIMLFCDMSGESPRGSIPDPNEGMVKKVLGDCTSKLWWVHSEALYTSLLFADALGYEHYERIKDYTLRTFPNRENDRGEWIQIRDRLGRPENRVVALPVKDPFHIMRNLLLLVELCEKRADQSQF